MSSSRTSPPDSLISESSGNVFADLGFPPTAAARLLREADLIIAAEIRDRAKSGDALDPQGPK